MVGRRVPHPLRTHPRPQEGPSAQAAVEALGWWAAGKTDGGSGSAGVWGLLPRAIGVQPSDRPPEGAAAEAASCDRAALWWQLRLLKGNRGTAGSAPAPGRLQRSDSELRAHPGAMQELDSNQLEL